MALKKKPVDPVPPSPDDVAKLKQEMAKGAKAVSDAAAKMPLSVPMDLSLDTQWQQAQDRVRRMDNEFGDIDVRVLKMGPNGQLNDVTDRVSPRDILPEQIERFDSSDGSVQLPRRSNGEIDHDATLDFMSRLIGINRSIRRPGGMAPESTAAMREMEELLAKSERILAKLRR